MNFNIDIKDEWIDEELLGNAVQSTIINKVTSKIIEENKIKIENLITQKVKAVIDNSLQEIIDTELERLISEGMVIGLYGKTKGERITLKQYIEELFLRSSGWSNPQDHITRVAKAFGEGLKLQYNNAFANRIVMNMKEQGLLKDEVVQILLESK